MTHEQAVEVVRALVGGRSGLTASQVRYAETSATVPTSPAMYLRVVEDRQRGQPYVDADGDLSQRRELVIEWQAWGSGAVDALRLALQRVYAEGDPDEYRVGMVSLGSERNATIQRGAAMLPMLRVMSTWSYVRTSTALEQVDATAVGLTAETDDMGPLTETIDA